MGKQVGKIIERLSLSDASMITLPMEYGGEVVLIRGLRQGKRRKNGKVELVNFRVCIHSYRSAPGKDIYQTNLPLKHEVYLGRCEIVGKLKRGGGVECPIHHHSYKEVSEKLKKFSPSAVNWGHYNIWNSAVNEHWVIVGPTRFSHERMNALDYTDTTLELLG